MTGVDSTQWGVVPKYQALVNSFDANLDARKYQDVGYDGLTNDNEKTILIVICNLSLPFMALDL